MHGLPEAAAAAQASTVKIGRGARNAVGDEGAIGSARLGVVGAELRQDKVGVLPGRGLVPEQRSMPRPRVTVERVEIGHHAGAQRVQMDVPEGFEAVSVLVDQGRLEAVLEEMPGALMAVIEGGSIVSEQDLPACRQAEVASPETPRARKGPQSPEL